MLVHHEGHDPGLAIIRRIRRQGEAADHLALDDVVVFAARGMFALPGEDLVIVTVERFSHRIGVAALNLHGSLLPKFRGRAPANWVLVEGESETGVTLHEMVEKPDAGDIIAQKKIEIAFEDDVYTLYMKMIGAARQLMKETLPKLADGSFIRTPQTGASSYFGGRKPEDGLIRWQKDALSLYNLTRAVTHPYPGAFTYLKGRKLFVWKADPKDGNGGVAPGKVVSSDPLMVSTGKGTLKLLRVQLEGEEEMDAGEFASLHGIDNEILGGGA